MAAGGKVDQSPDDTLYTEADGVLVNSGEYSGLSVREASARLIDDAKRAGFGGTCECLSFLFLFFSPQLISISVS